MGMLTTGLNAIRDLHSTILSHIEVGTGTDSETAEDTDLQTPIADTEVAVDSSTTTSQQLVKQGTITSISASGEDVTEVGWKTSSPELMQSRITHTALSHTIAEDVIYETRWFYRSLK